MMRAARRPVLALPLLLLAATTSHAQGQWTTYLRATSGNDVIALRDTVLISTPNAGLLRYLRSSDRWESVNREPSGLASNNVGAMAFDRSGNLFASVPGAGLSRLDTGGRWSLINAFDGLPSDSVLSLRAQGDTLWIGTTRGLALWNGRVIAGSIPDRGTESPFANDFITGIAITGDTLFVGTPNGAYLAKLSERLANWTAITAGLPTTPSILSMACDGHTVAVTARGKNPSNPAQTVSATWSWSASNRQWLIDVPTSPAVEFGTRRVRDDFGTIVCTSLSGIYRRRGPADWELIPGSPVTNNGDGLLIEPALDPDGVLFATSNAGALLQQDTQNPPAWITRRPPGPVGSDARNLMWVNGSVYATFDSRDAQYAGISRLRDGAWRNYPANTPVCLTCDTTFAVSVFAAAMLADPRGYRWIGMWSGPLTRFQDEIVPPFFQNNFFRSSAADTAHLHSTVHAAAADSSNGRWFGLDSDRIGDANGNPLGLDVYDSAGTFVRNFGPGYPGLRNGLVRALVTDKANVVWVGYKGNGLSRFEAANSLTAPITLQDVPPPPDGTNIDVFGLASYGDSIWVLAADGLHRYRRGAVTYAGKLAIAAPPSLLSVHPLAVTPDGTVWVGTYGGVRMHRRGQFPVDFTTDNSPLGNNEVRAIYPEPGGAVWIATAGGVHRFDPNFVPPAPPRLAALRVKLYPNPAWLTGAGFDLHVTGLAASYQGEVFDLNGRLVHRFSVGGNGSVFWNGRDLDERWVGPGVYFVRVRGGGAEATSRVVVLR